MAKLLQRLKGHPANNIVGLLIIFSLFYGECWHFANPDLRHTWHNGFWLTHDYFYLFLTRDVNLILYSIAGVITHKLADNRAYRYWWGLFLFFILDLGVYLHNGNTEHEIWAYNICGVLEFAIFIYYNILSFIKGK